MARGRAKKENQNDETRRITINLFATKNLVIVVIRLMFYSAFFTIFHDGHCTRSKNNGKKLSLSLSLCLHVFKSLSTSIEWKIIHYFARWSWHDIHSVQFVEQIFACSSFFSSVLIPTSNRIQVRFSNSEWTGIRIDLLHWKCIWRNGALTCVQYDYCLDIANRLNTECHIHTKPYCMSLNNKLRWAGSIR